MGSHYSVNMPGQEYVDRYLSEMAWDEEAPPPPSCLLGVTFGVGVVSISLGVAFFVWVLVTEVLSLFE